MKQLLILASLLFCGVAQAAITFVGCEGAHESNSPDVTVSVPAGTADGDFMYGFYSHATVDTTPVTLTGWDKFHEIASLGAELVTAAWTRTASSEPANYTFDGSTTSTTRTTGVICVFRDDDGVDVTFVEADHYKVGEDTASPTPAPITTVTDAAWVILYSFTADNNMTDVVCPTGYDERFDMNEGFGKHIEVCSKEIASAGTETPGQFNHTGMAATDDTAMLTLALKPAADGPCIPCIRRRMMSEMM